MSAGILKMHQAPHCGCCDRPNAFAVCARCDEPMCAEHFVRQVAFDGAVSYVCTICAEMLASDGMQRSTAGGAA